MVLALCSHYTPKRSETGYLHILVMSYFLSFNPNVFVCLEPNTYAQFQDISICAINILENAISLCYSKDIHQSATLRL